jgi:hypothetical protein
MVEIDSGVPSEKIVKDSMRANTKVQDKSGGLGSGPGYI